MIGMIAKVTVAALGGMVVGMGIAHFSGERQKERKEADEKAKIEKAAAEARAVEMRRAREQDERRHVEALSPEGQKAYFEEKARSHREALEKLETVSRKQKVVGGLVALVGITARMRGLGWGVIIAARPIAIAIVEALQAIVELFRRPVPRPVPQLGAVTGPFMTVTA